jgi:Sulfotransferase family
MERNAARFAPIFVLAPARSYSSVITTMLGQHPSLAGLPELKLFAYSTVGELEASLPQYWIERGITHRSPGLIRAIAELLFGDQSCASLEKARAWLGARPMWSGGQILDVLMECTYPRVCVEKSPESVESDAALERLAVAYPRARYLHLTRHPITTESSIATHRERLMSGWGAAGRPMIGIAAWSATHWRILQFAKGLPVQRYLRLRAEDILNDAVSHLAAIAGWLGLRTDRVAIESMQHPERSPYACAAPEGSGLLGGNDPAFLHDPRPRTVPMPSGLQKPHGWSASESDWQLVVELAAELGYAA